jgi:hypothetical protein
MIPNLSGEAIHAGMGVRDIAGSDRYLFRVLSTASEHADGDRHAVRELSSRG